MMAEYLLRTRRLRCDIHVCCERAGNVLSGPQVGPAQPSLLIASPKLASQHLASCSKAAPAQPSRSHLISSRLARLPSRSLNLSLSLLPPRNAEDREMRKMRKDSVRLRC